MTTSDEAFCHDHIEHPLMWCDEKRRLVERKNAEESMRMWRRRKTEEMARKEKDKQEVSMVEGLVMEYHKTNYFRGKKLWK